MGPRRSRGLSASENISFDGSQRQGGPALGGGVTEQCEALPAKGQLVGRRNHVLSQGKRPRRAIGLLKYELKRAFGKPNRTLSRYHKNKNRRSDLPQVPFAQSAKQRCEPSPEHPQGNNEDWASTKGRKTRRRIIKTKQDRTAADRDRKSPEAGCLPQKKNGTRIKA